MIEKRLAELRVKLIEKYANSGELVEILAAKVRELKEALCLKEAETVAVL